MPNIEDVFAVVFKSIGLYLIGLPICYLAGLSIHYIQVPETRPFGLCGLFVVYVVMLLVTILSHKRIR